MVFNTYGRQLSLMLFTYWVGLCVVDRLAGKTRRSDRTALFLSGLLDIVLLLLSLFGVMVIFDTQFYWLIAQSILCLLFLVCCGWELRRASKANRGFLISCCLLIFSIVADLVVGAGESIQRAQAHSL